jgi:hypothetical protein
MRSSLSLFLVLAVVACKKSEAPAPPPVAGAPAAAQSAAIRGKVLERIDAAPYSYLRLSTAAGETWAAVPQTTVDKGAEVAVENPMPMDGFESKTLKRKFDKIYFGMLPQAGAPAAAPGAPPPAAGEPQGMPAGMPPAGMPPAGMPPGLPPGVAAQHAAAASGPADVGDVKVTRAQGADAHTVAEVWSQKATLKEKKVTVRGKVVKFSGGIMGRNWVHLRDGSGTAAKGDNDITVTTRDSAAVGDVVVAKGVVRLAKDFGAGYAYPVIIEEAQVAK